MCVGLGPKCALKPCFPFVECEETPREGLGFKCGECPPGYTGDGIRCDDVNEVNCNFVNFPSQLIAALPNCNPAPSTGHTPVEPIDRVDPFDRVEPIFLVEPVCSLDLVDLVEPMDLVNRCR